jgi:hypothetical protein
MQLETMKLLGIPRLTTHLAQRSGTWPGDYYLAARRVQELEGFNPCTTDYAEAHGYPIMEVFQDDIGT